MAKKKIQTPEDIARLVQEGLDREKADLQKNVKRGYIPSNATRSFEIGQRVEFGAHRHCVVIEKDETGLLYLLHLKYEIEKGGMQRAESVDKKMWVDWTNVFPYRTIEDVKDIPQFAQKEEMRLQFFQSSIYAFDSIVYSAGLDLNPDYQRGHVWSMEDKEKLIDSIFRGIDIGKFVFIQRDFATDKDLYEILDGKQRLTTIMEFREDRFRYRGLLYSELHPRDQNHIDTYSISQAQVTNPTKEQIYNYFLKLNTGGKPMDTAQLEKVEKLLEEEKKKKEA